MFIRQRQNLVIAGEAFPMAHDLVPAHARCSQRRRDRGGLREGKRENKRLLVGVAGLGFLREGAAARCLPPRDVAGVGSFLRGL
jgi:hypothetical protein